MSTEDGVPYRKLIKDRDVRKFWQEHMTTASLLQQTAADPKSWTTFFGGFLVAGVALLLEKLLRKVRSRHYHYSPILEAAATEPSFRMGARLLVAKHFGKSRRRTCLAWRSLEVVSNQVFMFGIVMLVVWWTFFLGWKLVQAPPLMNTTTTPCATFGSGCRWVLFSMAFCAVYVFTGGPNPLAVIRNPLLAPGALLRTKEQFLSLQFMSLPSWLPMNVPWCPWGHHLTSLVTSWDAMDLVKWLFFVPTLVLSAMYFVATMVSPCWTACSEEGSDAGATDMRQDIVDKVLAEETCHNDAAGTRVIVVDGVRFAAEVGFSWYRVFESIRWTQRICTTKSRLLQQSARHLLVLLVLLDIILDVNSVFTLITAQQYRIALALQLVVSYSLLHQFMDGQIQQIFQAASASSARGILRDDLIALLHQARRRGIKVSTAAQIPVQVFSILLSVHGLATFLYEQVDLELADDAEDLASKATWQRGKFAETVWRQSKVAVKYALPTASCWDWFQPFLKANRWQTVGFPQANVTKRSWIRLQPNRDRNCASEATWARMNFRCDHAELFRIMRRRTWMFKKSGPSSFKRGFDFTMLQSPTGGQHA
eukprot:s739_g27.t1